MVGDTRKNGWLAQEMEIMTSSFMTQAYLGLKGIRDTNENCRVLVQVRIEDKKFMGGRR